MLVVEQAEEGEQAAVADGGEKEEEAAGKEGPVEDAADVAAVAEAEDEDEEKEEDDEQEKKDEEEEGEEGEEAAAPPADAAPTAAEVSASRLGRSCPVTLHAAFQLTACGLALPRCITSLASTPLPPTYICCFYRLPTSPHTSSSLLHAASATNLPPSLSRSYCFTQAEEEAAAVADPEIKIFVKGQDSQTVEAAIDAILRVANGTVRISELPPCPSSNG